MADLFTLPRRIWSRRVLSLLLCSAIFASYFALHALASGDDEEEEEEGEENEPSGRDSAVIGNKVGACFVFFIVSFIGVWLPYFVLISDQVMKLGLSLSAGLFVSLGLGYFIREADEAFHEVLEDSGDDYPYANMTVLIGFLLCYLADLIAQVIWAQKDDAPEEKEIESGVKGADGQQKEFGPTIGGAITAADSGKLTIINIVIMIMALGFHAVFEGLSVGLTNDISEMWSKTGSICIAEFFEGLALGTALRSQDASRSPLVFFIYATGASLIAPLGLAIGIIVDASADEMAAEWAEGIGNALATGVFVFVGTVHLLTRSQKPSPGDKPWMPFLKWFMLGIGVMIVSLLNLR